MHTPVHTTASVNSTYPKGDRGGNSIKIEEIDGVDDLHAVWDSVLFEYKGSFDLPLNENDWKWYTD